MEFFTKFILKAHEKDNWNQIKAIDFHFLDIIFAVIENLLIFATGSACSWPGSIILKVCKDDDVGTIIAQTVLRHRPQGKGIATSCMRMRTVFVYIVREIHSTFYESIQKK